MHYEFAFDLLYFASSTVVVIKYVPAVGDSKRALDEYVSEIFMGGKNVSKSHFNYTHTLTGKRFPKNLFLKRALLCTYLL